MTIVEIKILLLRVTMSCLDKTFSIRVERGNKASAVYGRIFLQAMYKANCTKTGKLEEWKGRKFYLSDHMTKDEVIKTAYVAFEACIKHEIMEGFKVDGKVLFNPHINFEELLKVSHKEIKRK